VEDLFKGLGPVAIFSAKHHWTAPRTVQLHRGDGEVGFGFSVRGDSPVIIAGVDHGSLAHVSAIHYVYEILVLNKLVDLRMVLKVNSKLDEVDNSIQYYKNI
jgi:hypothetical protein